MSNSAEQIAEAIIRHFEAPHGPALKMYICPSGKPTIGIGHVILPNEQELLHREISLEEADRLFEHDFNYFAGRVDALVHAELKDYQYAALVAFVFNVGVGNFLSSTLLKDLNSKRLDLVPHEMSRWVHGDHVDRVTHQKEVLPGLVRRRKCEAFVFQGGTIQGLEINHWFQHDHAAVR